MSCFIEKEKDDVVVVLSFKRDELLYDIENYCFIEGDVTQAESDKIKHDIQAIGDDGNVDRVTRVLNLRMAKCKELLYPYTKHEVHRKELDDVLKEPGVYGIILKVPTTYSQTTINYMEQLIHEYLVCEVMTDWMSFVNMQKVEMWKLRSEEAKKELKSCLCKRITGIRRKMHPF